MHRRTALLVALPQPRHTASAAADVVASHAGLSGSVLPNEGAQTHAFGISTGPVAVFVRLSAPSPGGGGCSPVLAAKWLPLPTLQIIWMWNR